MNILCLCQLFEVGTDAGSERYFYFCKYAASNGHNVYAISSNVDYKNARVKLSGEKGAVRRLIEGVNIYYVYSYANFRGSFIKRFYYYVTYFFSAIVQSLKLKGTHVIYAVSTPLTVGLLGFVISRLQRVPFVFEVTDIWPDAAVACGVVKNKAVIKMAHWLERFCYHKAAHIIGLSRGICDNIIAKGVAPGKVSLITNGVDFSLFDLAREDSRRSEIRNEYGFNGHFIAMYLGAHGAYNALDTIIDAAVELKDDTRFVFVFVGAGDEKPKLQQRVSDKSLANVIFLPPIPRVKSPAMLAAADAFVLPNRKGNFFFGNLPNKLFDFMASARPVVVAGTGETADLVTAAGCGRVGGAEDGTAMALTLIELAEMPEEERLAMGVKGRDYVRMYFDRKKLSEQFLKIIAEAAQA